MSTAEQQNLVVSELPFADRLYVQRTKPEAMKTYERYMAQREATIHALDTDTFGATFAKAQTAKQTMIQAVQG